LLNRLFLFLQAITMLSICGFLGFSGFLLWEGENARKEKKTNLDLYYIRDLKACYMMSYDIYKEGKKSTRDYNEEIKKTEAIMLKDGYDRAEILQINQKAFDEAEAWSKYLKQSAEEYAKEIEHADRAAEQARSSATKPTERPQNHLK
jgi:hypothetical protein